MGARRAAARLLPLAGRPRGGRGCSVRRGSSQAARGRATAFQARAVGPRGPSSRPWVVGPPNAARGDRLPGGLPRRLFGPARKRGCPHTSHTPPGPFTHLMGRSGGTFCGAQTSWRQFFAEGGSSMARICKLHYRPARSRRATACLPPAPRTSSRTSPGCPRVAEAPRALECHAGDVPPQRRVPTRYEARRGASRRRRGRDAERPRPSAQAGTARAEADGVAAPAWWSALRARRAPAG